MSCSSTSFLPRAFGALKKLLSKSYVVIRIGDDYNVRIGKGAAVNIDLDLFREEIVRAIRTVSLPASPVLLTPSSTTDGTSVEHRVILDDHFTTKEFIS